MLRNAEMKKQRWDIVFVLFLFLDVLWPSEVLHCKQSRSLSGPFKHPVCSVCYDAVFALIFWSSWTQYFACDTCKAQFSLTEKTRAVFGLCLHFHISLPLKVASTSVENAKIEARSSENEWDKAEDDFCSMWKREWWRCHRGGGSLTNIYDGNNIASFDFPAVMFSSVKILLFCCLEISQLWMTSFSCKKKKKKL